MESGQVVRGTCIQAGRCVSSPLHPLRRDLMHVMARVIASMTRVNCVLIKGRCLPASVYTSTSTENRVQQAHQHQHPHQQAQNSTSADTNLCLNIPPTRTSASGEMRCKEEAPVSATRTSLPCPPRQHTPNAQALAVVRRRGPVHRGTRAGGCAGPAREKGFDE